MGIILRCAASVVGHIREPWTTQLITVMFLGIILLLLVSGHDSDCSQRMGTGAMAYVESLNPVQTISGHMRISVRVDLSSLRHESELFAHGFATVCTMCVHLLAAEQHDLCERILYVDQQTYRSVVERMEYINSVAAARAPQLRRSARNLNFDADSPTASVSPRTNSIERGDQFLTTFRNFLNTFDNDTIDEIDPIVLRLVVKKVSATLVPLARAIETKQEAFLKVLQPGGDPFNCQTFLQHFISPTEKERLVSAVRNNSANILHSPSGRTDRDVWEMFNAADIHCTFEADFAVVRLRIPMVTPVVYEAIKVTVLPQIIGDVLVFPQTDHDVLLIDRTRNVTLSLEHSRYRSNCKHLSLVVLCDLELDVALGKDSTSQHNCLRSLVPERLGAPCHSVLMRSTVNFWLATLNPNVWLYIAPFRETVAITFNGHRTELNVLNGVGLFELQPKMKAQIGDRVFRYTEGSAIARGRIVSLGVQVSNETQGLLESLRIPLVKMHGSLLVTEREKFELCAQGVAEEMLLETWRANQESMEETGNVILYHVLAVLVVLIVVLVRIALSTCGKTVKKPPNDEDDHNRAMTTNKRDVNHSNPEVDDNRRRPCDSRKVNVNLDVCNQGNGSVPPHACLTCKE